MFLLEGLHREQRCGNGDMGFRFSFAVAVGSCWSSLAVQFLRAVEAHRLPCFPFSIDK